MRASAALALRTLRVEPGLLAGQTTAACVLGDEASVAAALGRDPSWANRPEGPFGMPPLVAVTHSRLILEHGFEPRLLACAALLLRHGADVNGTWVDPRWPDSPLSALYGAAGRTHNASMTALLLAGGAKPDDDESLYHSVEARDGACTRLLLDAGARVTGTNSIGRVLDFDKPDRLRLLLRHGGDATERPWIHHAILRGRSREHVVALLEAGADPRAVNADGVTLFAYAAIYGRADVLDLLGAAGVEEPLSEAERFLAACTRRRRNRSPRHGGREAGHRLAARSGAAAGDARSGRYRWFARRARPCWRSAGRSRSRPAGMRAR